MAYTPQGIKIIPGGLNLLAPGDQVAAGDCIDLSGWWPGAAGKLQQAPGYTALATDVASVYMDGICQESGRTYYSGAPRPASSGSLYQIGVGSIASGFDGYPLGMIGYRGYCWIMNRASSKQLRDSGTGTPSAWTPAAPGVPVLTNPAVTSASLTITELDPANPDATSGDFLTIRMWTSSSIAGLEVGGLMTIATGGAATDFDGTWQVTAIYDGPTSLIELAAHVPAGTVFSTAGGMTATFANPGMPMGTWNYWVTWAYDDLGESNPSTVTGTITATAVSVTALGTKVHVSIASLTPPTGATHWNVYRQGPGMPSPYRVNLDPIAVATTTYDDYGDASHSQDNDYLIDSLGIIMEGDHDPAPRARVIANDIYNGRILVANSAAYPNRIWFTPPLQPGFFRGSGNPQAGDWVDVGKDRGDEILYMAVRPGQVTIYRAKSIWRHVGDFGDPNARLDVSVPDLGIVGPRAVACSSTGDYFRSTEGVYKYNGDWAQKISAKLDPVFRSGADIENYAPETSTARANCALGLIAGRLWLSYTWGPTGFSAASGTVNNGAFVYHIDSDRWFGYNAGAGAFLNTGTGLIGATFNTISTMEDGTDYGIVAGAITYQSAYEDAGLPDHEKTWADLVVTHYTAGRVVTVSVRTNKSETAADIFDLDTVLFDNQLTGGFTKTVIPLVYPLTYSVVALRGEPIRSFNLSVRLSTLSAVDSVGVTIETPLILHYYVEARKGKTFDTGPTQHGIEGVKTIDQIEVDIDAPADASLLIRGDIPGGVLVNQLRQTIAATTGRQVRRLVLANAGVPLSIDAKLFRDLITSDEDFHVYGFRVRCLPIGVYLDGAIGDFWDSEPIAIGA